MLLALRQQGFLLVARGFSPARRVAARAPIVTRHVAMNHHAKSKEACHRQAIEGLH